MDQNLGIQDSLINSEEGKQCMNSFVNSNSDKATEEEFQNFMHRVTEVEKAVKQLASTDITEQKHGMLLADEILGKKNDIEITEDTELKIKVNRTFINKYSPDDGDPNKMSQEAFKRSIEKDAQVRAEDRKARNERAETYKRIGIGAFREADFEKAVTYFSKAVEQRKDSALLWNNRALSYMRLGLFEKALSDCEWALKVNEDNVKALLNSAKCHKCLGNEAKCKEFIALARERNPHLNSYITEFEEGLSKDRTTNKSKDTDHMID
ncbi:hypothetical protein QAD02_016053 [Eretmocerus hayati]|uniref:Uncharacterized protein n=1 Tax=Eretmocerus hayati TaxID=131215 RepID=A0ACC2PBA0_9HYME|nr:hypothetical protein QAD02_016053 [Eretmocerus hayati]